MQPVRISVAVPTHKRAKYLRICLESILTQTLLPNEIIVSEDGDDPETLDVVYSMLNRGVTIRHVRNCPPLLQLANRQQAFKMASGEYVAMLDDDDKWEPTFLEETSGVLSRYPECGFCATDHFIMGESGEILVKETEDASDRFGRCFMQSGTYDDVFLRVLQTCPFSLQHTLFRRDVLERVGFFQPYGRYVPDLVLFATLGAQRVNAYYIAERLGRYRVHDGQQTVNRIENAESRLEFLETFHARHSVIMRPEERNFLEKLYIQQITEVAIARAHMFDKLGAVHTLTRMFRFGFGIPPLRRVLVLGALFAGVKK